MQQEERDTFNRACDWLLRKYHLHLPEIELSPVPLAEWKDSEGVHTQKGLFTVADGRPKIVLFDGDDIVQGLFHEYHHYIDALLGATYSDTSVEERFVEARAWQDLKEFFGLVKEQTDSRHEPPEDRDDRNRAD